MPRKLLQIGGLLMVCLFVILAVNSFINSRHTAASTCNGFIKAIQKGDTAKSYRLFSKNLATQEPADVWKTHMASLNKVYSSSASFKLVKEKESLNPNTQALEKELNYQLTNPSTKYKYDITCRTVKTGKQYLVDSYVSHLAE